MKWLKKIIFLGISLFVLGQVVEASISLNLKDILDMAEYQSLEVLKRKESVNVSYEQMMQARAKLLPAFDVRATQAREHFRESIAGNETALNNEFDARIRGSMPILNLPKLGGYESAKKALNISSWEFKSFLQGAYKVVARAYYTHLRNLRKMQVIDQTLVRDQAFLSLAIAQKEAQLATRIDVTRAEVQLASGRKRRLKQETFILQSELELKRLLNICLDEPVELVDEYSKPAPEPKDYGLSMCDALLNRPDVRSAEEVVDKDRYDMGAVKWEHLPSLDIYSDFGRAGNVPHGAQDKVWKVQGGITIPVFEGFRVVSKVREARSRLRASEYALDDIKNKVFQQYEVAKKDYITNFEQIKLALTKVGLSREEVELAKNRFKEGLADNLELIDAQTKLTDSEDEWVEDQYQYYLSNIEMAFTLGDVRLALQ